MTRAAHTPRTVYHKFARSADARAPGRATPRSSSTPSGFPVSEAFVGVSGDLGVAVRDLEEVTVRV